MIKKLKTASFSILPIVAFVLVYHLFVHRFSTEVLLSFIVGAGILILGQSVFLIGIERSIEPMGEFVGSSVQSNKRFYIYILFGLFFGILSTIAEPDIQVFAVKVAQAGISSKLIFMVVAGLGVGVFISIALVRLVSKVSLNIVLFLSYLIVFVLAIFVSDVALGMSLDAGANTTGVVTSPFLLALGVGVNRVVGGARNKDEDSFGLIALSSVGPIISVLLLCLLTKGTAGEVVAENVTKAPLWLETLQDVSLSVIPLVVCFFIFEALFIKISTQEKKKLLLGSVITFVGFYLFLFGIELGLSPMGTEFGKALKLVDSTTIIVVICAALGFFIVFSEPSIKILAGQVESVTNRNVSRGLVVGAIALSIVLSITVVILKIEYGFSIWWVAGIVYGLAFVLMPFVPKLFTAIAFDSSGVATGTLTVAFIFPICAGLSGDVAGSFGAIAIMTMMPILVMEVIGLVYNISLEVDKRATRKILMSLSKTEDKFSNISKLKKKHEENYNGN